MANPIYENTFNEFKPIARIGEYIALITKLGKERYFRVVNIEPVAFIGDLIPLTKKSSIDPGAEVEIVPEDVKKILAVDTKTLLHYRLIPEDDFWFAYEISGRRMQLKNVSSWLGRFLLDKAPNLLEWFVYEENVPKVIVKNPGTTALTSLRFTLIGFTYKLEEQPTKPVYVTYIPIYAEI